MSLSRKREDFFGYLKRRPVMTGILAGLGVAIVATAIVAAVVFSGGIAAGPIAAGAIAVGSAITSGTFAGTSAAILGATVIGTGIAVGAAGLGALGGKIAGRNSVNTKNLKDGTQVRDTGTGRKYCVQILGKGEVVRMGQGTKNIHAALGTNPQLNYEIDKNQAVSRSQRENKVETQENKDPNPTEKIRLGR